MPSAVRRRRSVDAKEEQLRFRFSELLAFTVLQQCMHALSGSSLSSSQGMANNKRHPLSCVSGSPRAPDPVSFYSRSTIVPGCLYTFLVPYRVSNTWSLNPETQNSVAINCGDQRKRPLRLRPPCLGVRRVCAFVCFTAAQAFVATAARS